MGRSKAHIDERFSTSEPAFVSRNRDNSFCRQARKAQWQLESYLNSSWMIEWHKQMYRKSIKRSGKLKSVFFGEFRVCLRKRRSAGCFWSRVCLSPAAPCELRKFAARILSRFNERLLAGKYGSFATVRWITGRYNAMILTTIKRVVRGLFPNPVLKPQSVPRLDLSYLLLPRLVDPRLTRPIIHHPGNSPERS